MVHPLARVRATRTSARDPPREYMLTYYYWAYKKYGHIFKLLRNWKTQKRKFQYVNMGNSSRVQRLFFPNTLKMASLRLEFIRQVMKIYMLYADQNTKQCGVH
jgi:hypothetical protein